MELKETNRMWNIINNTEYPGEYVAFIAFKGDKALFNGEEMSGQNAVEQAYSEMIHGAIECSCFFNGNWLKRVEYTTDLEEVHNQTEEDLYIDMEKINFLFSLKIIYNECLKNPEDVYVASYDSDSGCYFVDKNEEIMYDITEMEKGYDKEDLIEWNKED